MTYSATKFEIATSNGLGGDTFTRNLMIGHIDGRTTDRLWYEINIPFFLKKKTGITTLFKSKKDGKYQGTIQSCTTPDPGYHMGK